MSKTVSEERTHDGAASFRDALTAKRLAKSTCKKYHIHEDGNVVQELSPPTFRDKR